MTYRCEHPLLLAVCRPPGAIATDELQQIARLGGLDREREIHAISMMDDSQPDPARDLDLANYCAVIVTGSPFGYHEPEETKSPQHRLVETRAKRLMNRLVAVDKPTLAICYGLQAIAQSLGGSLTGDYPEDLQAPHIHLTEAGQTDPLTSQLPQHFRSYTGHSDAVAKLPHGAVVLARGDFCPVQMVRLGDNVYGTQFHPEITTKGMHICINSYGDTYYPAAEKAAVIERCDSADVSGANQLIQLFADRYVHNRH